MILNQAKETSTLISFLRDCKKALKPRHWAQIFTIIKAPHLKTSTKFTIINLREVHIQNYMDEVNKVIEQAEQETKYENIIAKIEHEWDYMKLKVVPYALSHPGTSTGPRSQGSEAFVLADTEAIFDTIEDHLTTLETVYNSK